MVYIGFTNIFDFKDKTDEELLKFAKTLALADFAKKMAVFSNETIMMPYSIILYDIIYKRFGFELNDFNESKLNNCDNHLEGLKIETEEVTKLINHYINENKTDYTDKIRQWFGKGEFPFIMTDIYRFDDYDVVAYYISR